MHSLVTAIVATAATTRVSHKHNKEQSKICFVDTTGAEF